MLNRSRLPLFYKCKAIPLVLALVVVTNQAAANLVQVTGKGLIQLNQMVSRPSKDFFNLGALSSKKLREAGVAKVEVLPGQKDVALVFLDANQQILKKFVVNRSTPQQLEPFRPSKIRQWSESLKNNSGKIVLSRAKHFPVEASSFFVALGALTVYDLIFNYSSNPLVAEQFLQAQKDPVTHLSFLAFMAANGLAVEPLMELVEKPWLRGYLPYMGMAVGMAASHIVHGVAHSELLKSCSKSLLSAGSDQNRQQLADKKCDQAWDGFGQGWGPVVSDFSTSLVTMFLSSAVAAGVTWAVTASFGKVIQMMGMELVSFALPGGAVGKAVRFLFHTGNNLHFLAWDAYLRKPVDDFFINAGANKQIERQSQCIDALVTAASRAHWQKEIDYSSGERFTKRHFCSGDVVTETKALFENYRQWRSANLKDQVLAQQNWLHFLGYLTSHYRTTQSFYQDLTDKLYKKLYRQQPGQVSPLDQTAPLFGVKTSADTPIDWFLQLDNPKGLEAQQIQHVNFVAQQMGVDRQAADGMYQSLTTKEKLIFDQVQSALSQNDSQKMAQGLQQLNRVLDRQGRAMLKASDEFLTSETFKKGISEIKVLLGEPDPQLQPGASFLRAWIKNENLDPDQRTPFPGRIQHITTNSATEYLVASMIWGPDLSAGEKSVGPWGYTGFQAYFQPPRLIPSKKVHRLGIFRDETVFDQKIYLESDTSCSSQEPACFRSLFNWIRAGHIKPEIMNAQGNQFSVWWDETARPQYLEAWKNFETKYEAIVQGLGDKMFVESNHYANSTVVPNNLLMALDQERKISQFLLSQIHGALAGASQPKGEINGKYDLIKRATSFSLKIQAFQNYEASWVEMKKLVSQIRSPLKTSKNQTPIFVSRVQDQQLQQALKNLDQSHSQLASVFEGQTITQEGLQMIRLALESLKASHLEIQDYALILNTASYIENHQTGLPMRKYCAKTETQSKNPFRGGSYQDSCSP